MDTGRLIAGGRVVTLYGVEGTGNPQAKGMKDYIAASGNRVICQVKDSSGHVCLLMDGTDIALTALRNGAARIREGAPAEYKENERVASTERRGIWVQILGPPATILENPVVRDTATLVVDARTYRLIGIEGVGGSYAQDLQALIRANGNTLSCLAPNRAEYVTCTLPNGADLAQVLLFNGAARVASEASDTYRSSQREALDRRVGIWANLNRVPDSRR